MQTKKPWQALTIGSLAACAVGTVSAAGLGAGSPSAVLGQPLDFAVQVRLDAGEALGPECVTAEVTAGDRRVPPPLVRTVVEMTGPDTARVRVLTQPSMDEPVISVQLSVGCTSRIARRYVVLADPPSPALPSTVPGLASTPAPDAQAAVGSPAAPVAASAQPAAASPTAPSLSSTGTGDANASPAARTPRNPQARVALDPAEVERRARVRAERRAAAKAAREARDRARAPLLAAVPSAAGASTAPARLKLDFVEPPPAGNSAVELAMVAVAEAASAARAAASAASASAERIATLERTVEQLRTEAKSSRDLATQFRQRLQEAEGSRGWLLPLMAVAALLAALSAWLAWRLGKLQNARAQGWREAVAPAPAATNQGPVTEATPSRQPTAPIPFVTSELRPAAPAAALGRVRGSPAWPPPAPPVAWPPPDSTLSPEDTQAPEPEPATQRTEPILIPTRDNSTPRDVSIEELIDLEQQAEFFVVLGQDEAAIDLLVEHLRSTGGGSPLPYLKLLEIHHRRDDREAYERMRARFNQRFNAYAPEWGVDLGHGRALDDYAGVIPRLQQVWPRPLDAMAELEALLFRKSRGELFDLPAYREVLFLYSLARDLLDRGAADNGAVDLLLPMADGGVYSSTAPAPLAGLDRDAFRDTQIPDDRATGPVDFDVSAVDPVGIDRPTSIFDLLDDKPPVPGPRGTAGSRKP